MRSSFDITFYQRAHTDLDSESIKISLSIQNFDEQSQVVFSIWRDEAGKRIRQINILPMLEQCFEFKLTSKQYVQSSEERVRLFFEMDRLITEFSGYSSALNENIILLGHENDEYHRFTMLSVNHRDKSQELNCDAIKSSRRAEIHIRPM